MAPPSNDVPYCLLPSCKKSETFKELFRRKCHKTQIFDTWSPLIPGLRLFFKIPAMSLFSLYWPLTTRKVSEKTNERFLRYLKTEGHTETQSDKGNLLRTLWVNPGSKIFVFKKSTLLSQTSSFRKMWKRYKTRKGDQVPLQWPSKKNKSKSTLPSQKVSPFRNSFWPSIVENWLGPQREYSFIFGSKYKIIN